MKRFAIVFVGALLLWACGHASAGLVTDNLQLWLKADAIAGLNNNDPVSTWVDSSVNGRNATQSGAARPTYITGALNSKPVVRFDGFVDYMAVADNNVWAFSDFNMFVVVKMTATSSEWWKRSWLAQDDGSGPMPKWIWSYDPTAGSQIWHYYNGVTLWGAAWTPSTSQYYVLELRKSGSNYSFYEDGNANGTASSATPIPNASSPLTVGKAEQGTFQGDIAEVVIYNAALSNADRNQTGWYLGDKYGLTVSYIPEPSTMVLLSLGGLALLRRRKNARGATD